MAETYEVEFVDEGVTLDLAADESIPDAGELTGLSLPCRCPIGVCGVCCARREGDGEVDRAEGMSSRPMSSGRGTSWPP